MEFKNNLNKIRKEKNLSIRELSKQSGVNASYISRLERGIDTKPGLEVIIKLSKPLKVTPEELDPSIKEMANIWEKFDNEIDFNSLKEDEKITSAIEILLNHKGYKLSDFTEDEYKKIEKLVLEIIDLIAYKLSK